MQKERPCFVRRATMADLPQIQKLSSELIVSDNNFDHHLLKNWSFETDGEKYLTKRIRGRKGVCLVVEANRQIVGYCTGAILPIQKWRPFHRSELENIYIMENYRNAGVGTTLLHSFFYWSKEKGVDRIALYSMIQNKEAHRFYERQGFAAWNLVMEKVL